MDDQDEDDFFNSEEEDPRLVSERFVQVAVVFEGLFVFLAIFLGWVLEVTIWVSPSSTSGDMFLISKSLAFGALATVPLVILLILLENASLPQFEPVQEFIKDSIAPLFAKATFWELGAVALAAGLGEEALFRGLIQPWLVESIDGNQAVLIAILLSSILFGLLHFATVEYAIFAGLMSCYLGFLYWYTGDLIVPIAVHFLYDWFALVYLKNKYQEDTLIG